MVNHDEEIVRRELDKDRDSPAMGVAENLAELEGKSIEELETTWDCVDGVLDHIFSNPPSPEAQLTITFTYEGYRITVEQNGRAEFVKVT
ncbi:HalOD1 output domain-containing protein [Natronomonas gomsonensis]|uniref:HalOD1 output domain-containing protein n=1 Tax=Natronomonas gomsonensis TaxID=1046043 RepID=UPI0015BAEE26